MHFKHVKKCEICKKTCKQNAFWKCASKKCEKHVFRKCTWKKMRKKHVKNMRKNMWKNAKNVKNAENVKNVWKSSWEGGTLISSSSGLIFWGSSFAAVTLLPAQLLQVENRRGAVQTDRKWTVQIADLLNLAIAKQWLPGAKHKRTKPQNCLKKYIFSHGFTFLKCIFSHFFKLHFWNTFFHIFNSNYYNPSVAQLALISIIVNQPSCRLVAPPCNQLLLLNSQFFIVKSSCWIVEW